MNRRLPSLLVLLLLLLSPVAAPSLWAAPQTVTYRVTGLFSPDRVDDLKALIGGIPELSLAAVTYDVAEASFVYDDAQPPFKGAKPEQIRERLENLIRTPSQGTFGVLDRCAVPREKLERLEIPVYGLDCKACSYGAYLAVYQVPGVEQATASFSEGKVTVWLDTAKATRAAVEEALTKRRVPLKPET